MKKKLKTFLDFYIRLQGMQQHSPNFYSNFPTSKFAAITLQVKKVSRM